MAEQMPALFIGHGNPMNALLANPYTQRWAGIGTTLPRPKGILSVSAHWYIEDECDFGVFRATPSNVRNLY